MNYSEARKIVDEIIDGKKKVKVDGSLGVLISYLSKEKEEHNGKYDNRVKRYEKIEKNEYAQHHIDKRSQDDGL